MDTHVAPFRDEKGLQQGLAAIESLKAEVPKISVANIKRYNFELKEALETSFALDAAEITIGSCLFRTESRGHHNRTDYPDTNDQNWRCHTIVKQEGGKPVYAKRDVIYTRMKPED
jgi:succinate dehydrogenase/fumarate reductase flavoprotein subunit